MASEVGKESPALGCQMNPMMDGMGERFFEIIFRGYFHTMVFMWVNRHVMKDKTVSC
jgi:hypothetical protein